jgi:hypothetical protein
VRDSLHNVFLSSVASCIESVVMCALLFFLAVPLARLIRRSLTHAWDSTTPEVTNKAGLIEPLMAVLFRALAASLFLGAFCGAARITFVSVMHYSSSPSPVPFWETWITLVPFLIGIVIPILLFVLSRPFTRMLSKGLSRSLSSNPVNLVNPV